MRLNSVDWTRGNMVDWNNPKSRQLYLLKSKIGVSSLHGKSSCLFPINKFEPKELFDDTVKYIIENLEKEKYTFELCKYKFDKSLKSGVMFLVKWG